jgi:hypothetical protein
MYFTNDVLGLSGSGLRRYKYSASCLSTPIKKAVSNKDTAGIIWLRVKPENVEKLYLFSLNGETKIQKSFSILSPVNSRLLSYGAGFLRKLSCFFISSRIFKLSGVALVITGGIPERFRFFSLEALPAAG